MSSRLLSTEFASTRVSRTFIEIIFCFTFFHMHMLCAPSINFFFIDRSGFRRLHLHSCPVLTLRFTATIDLFTFVIYIFSSPPHIRHIQAAWSTKTVQSNTISNTTLFCTHAPQRAGLGSTALPFWSRKWSFTWWSGPGALTSLDLVVLGFMFSRTLRTMWTPGFTSLVSSAHRCRHTGRSTHGRCHTARCPYLERLVSLSTSLSLSILVNSSCCDVVSFSFPHRLHIHHRLFDVNTRFSLFVVFLLFIHFKLSIIIIIYLLSEFNLLTLRSTTSTRCKTPATPLQQVIM